MVEVSLEAVRARYRRAKEQRRRWEGLWRDCYAYALPQRAGLLADSSSSIASQSERLFDGTAPDAVEQLAASLLAELTPPWSSWFGLRPGTDVPPMAEGTMSELLDDAAGRIQSHLDRSNFAVEMHQCFLDLATIGTATMWFEEAPVGDRSAFRFTAIPAAEMTVDEDASGRISSHFRESNLTLAKLRDRFPDAILSGTVIEAGQRDTEIRFGVVEAVVPRDGGFAYLAFLENSSCDEKGGAPLAQGQFENSPFITFRWLKGASEIYGRSPVMTALPDIKTANKVVELILKNASISVTGIWQADDDGVLNPANIRLVPGAIIPKAVGSAGLTPLAAPGRFDVSQLVLDDLRNRIRHSLLGDRLGPVSGARMTATEVLTRSNEMSRLLGAIYGRLQTELLTPMLCRALAILRRRGELPDMTIDGHTVDLAYKSPLARLQARDDIQGTLMWLETATKLGAEALATVDVAATTRWLARCLGVPGELIVDAPPADAALAGLEMLAQAVADETADDA